jgi:hypothetical protein
MALGHRPGRLERRVPRGVEFNRLGDERTEVIVIHDRFPAGHDASPYRSGWEEGLEKLDLVITKGESNA